MTAPAEVLERAADLLEKPGAWTRGAYARRADGSPLGDGRSAEAISWDLTGALEAVSGGLVGRDLADPVTKVLKRKRSFRDVGGAIHNWNDAPGRTQSEVVAALRQASRAALSKAKGQRAAP